jgi:type I restriction enzyme S subunit
VGTLGETAIVKKETFTADRNLAIIRPNNLASSDYIKLYLDSPIVKNKLLVGSGSSAQPHLYLTDLRAFKITLPSKEEQQIIVDRVSKLFDIAVKIENKTEAANANINKLTQSILAKAFRGQL